MNNVLSLPQLDWSPHYDSSNGSSWGPRCGERNWLAPSLLQGNFGLRRSMFPFSLFLSLFFLLRLS